MTETTDTRWARHHENGRRLSRQGEYAAAEQAFTAATREALALGEDDLRLAASLTEWGQLKCKQGDAARAEAMLRRALLIRERRLGAEHPDVAGSLTNLGALYYLRGDFESAEPLLRRALEVAELALGAEHPDLAAPLNNLARLYFKRNDYASVTPLLTRLLALKERALGPEHPEVAAILTAVSRVRSVEGNHDDAEALARRALKIREKMLPPTDPAIASSLELVAYHCAARAKREEVWAAANSLLKREPSSLEAEGAHVAVRRALLEEEQALRERACAIRSQLARQEEPATLEPRSTSAGGAQNNDAAQQVEVEPTSPGHESSPRHTSAASAQACSEEAREAYARDEPLPEPAPHRSARMRQWLAGSWSVKRSQVVAAALVIIVMIGAWMVVVVRRKGSEPPAAPPRVAVVTAPSSPAAAAQPGLRVEEGQVREEGSMLSIPSIPSVRVDRRPAPRVPSFAGMHLGRAIERARTRAMESVRASIDSVSRRVDLKPPTSKAP